MSRLLPITVAIRTLRRQPLPLRCRISDEQALAWLRQVSGQDFGEDVTAWTAWLKANRWAYTRSPAQGPPLATDEANG
jgi:hypothetical protein